MGVPCCYLGCPVWAQFSPKYPSPPRLGPTGGPASGAPVASRGAPGAAPVAAEQGVRVQPRVGWGRLGPTGAEPGLPGGERW
jgi:hypothetical protein